MTDQTRDTIALRITRIEDADAEFVTLRLDGRVVAEAVGILERECRRLIEEVRKVRVDFSGVTFIDGRGVDMLKRISGQRLRVVNCLGLRRASPVRRRRTMRRMDAVTAAAPFVACHRVSPAEEPRAWRHEFEAVMLVHRDRLYRPALCRNRTDAENLMQEALLRAFRRFGRFTPGTSCLTWLATILRNIFLNQVTRPGREVLLGDEGAMKHALARRENIVPTGVPPERDRRQASGDGARSSTAGFREVLLRADVEGLSYRDFTPRCELPIGSVMSRLLRARRHLRKALTFGPAAAGSDGRRRRMQNGGAGVSTLDWQFVEAAGG